MRRTPKAKQSAAPLPIASDKPLIDRNEMERSERSLHTEFWPKEKIEAHFAEYDANNPYKQFTHGGRPFNVPRRKKKA